jgi:hypothetical protein
LYNWGNTEYSAVGYTCVCYVINTCGAVDAITLRLFQDALWKEAVEVDLVRISPVPQVKVEEKGREVFLLLVNYRR